MAYAVNYEPLIGTLERLDVGELVDAVTEPWWNQTLCQVGDVLVRAGVFEGEYHWHKHDDQDEFFFVLDGRIRIEMDGRDPVELGPRQTFIVPKGLRHRPVSPGRSTVLMLERAGVTVTGD